MQAGTGGEHQVVPVASLKAGTSATIEATIVSISPPRDVITRRGPARVADATLKDDSGTIVLSLWDRDIEQFHANQKIRITDGWVSDGYQGGRKIGRGHSGKIDVLE